jgi:hypothetical protein
MDSALLWEGAGREWTAFCSGSLEVIEASVALLGAEIVGHAASSLDDIFIARTAAHAGSR